MPIETGDVRATYSRLKVGEAIGSGSSSSTGGMLGGGDAFAVVVGGGVGFGVVATCAGGVGVVGCGAGLAGGCEAASWVCVAAD
jgi:hypothetical protein